MNKSPKSVSKHDILVINAAKWLLSRTNIVITEMAGIGEEADAIGFKNSYNTILIECKATRADFKADLRKYFRRDPARGMGSERYYLAPKGLIKANEIPDGWGLLEAKGEGGRVKVRKHGYRFTDRDIHKEMDMLVSALRRIGSKAVRGISAKVYTNETKNRCNIFVRRHNNIIP